MKVESSKYDKNITIIRIKGRLDVKQAEELENKLFSLIDTGVNKIIIDLKNVSYLGSSGIRIFLGAMVKLYKQGGKLKILHMPDTGLKILKAMEILDRFEIYKSEKKAIKSFKEEIQ